MRRSIGAGAIPMLADSLLRTSGECASFTKPGAARRNSHHWRENWTGGTTCSSFASTSAPKNASFTCVCHCVVRLWHPYAEVKGCVTILNCHEFHFFVFLLSSLADGLVVWERGNKWRCGSACWFAVGFRPCRCFDRQAQTLGTPKGSELGDSHVMAGTKAEKPVVELRL
jgi:hypothetical protein